MFEFKVRFFHTNDIVAAVFATHEEALEHLERFRQTIQSFEDSVRNIAIMATLSKLPELPKIRLHMVKPDVYHLARPVDHTFSTAFNSMCIIRIVEVPGIIESEVGRNYDYLGFPLEEEQKL